MTSMIVVTEFAGRVKSYNRKNNTVKDTHPRIMRSNDLTLSVLQIMMMTKMEIRMKPARYTISQRNRSVRPRTTNRSMLTMLNTDKMVMEIYNVAYRISSFR